jgi:hypothetical protein
MKKALAFLAVQESTVNSECIFTKEVINIVDTNKQHKTLIQGYFLHIDEPFFRTIRTSKDNGPYSDRLVPSYKKEQWLERPKEIDDNKQTIQLLLNLLDKEMRSLEDLSNSSSLKLSQVSTVLNIKGYNTFGLLASPSSENWSLLENKKGDGKEYGLTVCPVM